MATVLGLSTQSTVCNKIAHVEAQGEAFHLWKKIESHADGMVGDMNAQRHIACMHDDSQALCIE